MGEGGREFATNGKVLKLTWVGNKEPGLFSRLDRCQSMYGCKTKQTNIDH